MVPVSTGGVDTCEKKNKTKTLETEEKGIFQDKQRVWLFPEKAGDYWSLELPSRLETLHPGL